MLSHELPMCQLADLFAGMAAHSRDKSDIMLVLLEKANNQESLFEEPMPKPSNVDKERFPVIQYLYQKCQSKKFGLSFKTEGFLRTRDPKQPVNFWHYTPQHEKDRAPTKDLPKQ